MLSIDFNFSERFANDEKIISQGEMDVIIRILTELCTS